MDGLARVVFLLRFLDASQKFSKSKERRSAHPGNEQQ